MYTNNIENTIIRLQLTVFYYTANRLTMNFEKLFNQQPKNNIFDSILSEYCIKLTDFRAEGLYPRSPLFNKYITQYLLLDLQKFLAQKMAKMEASGAQLELCDEMIIITQRSQPVVVIYQTTQQICCLGLIPKYSKFVLDTFQAIQENICSNKLNAHLLSLIPNKWGKSRYLSRDALYKSKLISRGFVRPPVLFEYDLIGTSVIGKLNNIDLSKLFGHQIFVHGGIEAIKHDFTNIIRFIFGPVVMHRAELRLADGTLVVVYYTQAFSFDTRVTMQNIGVIANPDGTVKLCDGTCMKKIDVGEENVKAHNRGSVLSNDDLTCDGMMPAHFNIFAMLWELLSIRDAKETLDMFEQVFDCSVDEAQHEFIKIDRVLANRLLDRKTQKDGRRSNGELKVFKHNSVDVCKFDGFGDGEKEKFIRISSGVLRECIFMLKPLAGSGLLKIPTESEQMETVKNLLVLRRKKCCVYTDN